MAITSSLLLFIIGLIILVISSNWLIQASVKLSLLFKLTPLFVGAVLVAIGTSTPEAGVGIMAALRNQKGLALGTIIGSNIANIGLILGLCAIFRPLKVDKGIFKREMPFLVFSVFLFYFLSRDLFLSRFDGLIFIFVFVIFCFVSYFGARKALDHSEIKSFKISKSLDKFTTHRPVFLVILFSLAGVAWGSDIMVRNGVSLAKIFGLSPWIIGITVFALGTSLPELVTSLTASIKRIPSISIGNIIGSNICNIFFVLGLVAIIRPINLDPLIFNFEMPALIIFTLLFFTLMRTGYKISRCEGLIMFLGYIGFLVTLIIKRV
ncbi:MAG: calcium/sodium antiporter [Candidatus Omnitrophica bacterium]|nr:calcium/sodium antiporter [Candidatus Omnitrophota bacterium]